MNKCPMCGKELSTYQVTQLGAGSDIHEREVGCAKNNAPCLLSGHSWPLSRWDELCDLIASAGEGYPGAAHDRMDWIHQLDVLARTWHSHAELLAEVHPNSPANSAFRKCVGDLVAVLKGEQP
jgi:hypothetical protein